jgi:hypothetical protein
LQFQKTFFFLLEVSEISYRPQVWKKTMTTTKTKSFIFFSFQTLCLPSTLSQ